MPLSLLHNINALITQALQNFQAGNLEEAKKKLKYVLNAQTKNLAALEILGIIYANSGNLQQALKHFEEITKLKPDYAEAWSNSGNALQELKQYDQALASCDKAINLKNDYADAYWNKSLAQLLTSDFQGGWTNYEYRWLRKEAEKNLIRSYQA